ncbi:MAG: threonine synthase [Marinilabiliales bacterium]|nr:MAG: threonine synthase [Marinilabiliales bacterium]
MNKYYYSCINCGKEFDSSAIRYLCDECSKNTEPGNAPKGVLKVNYRYDTLVSQKESIKENIGNHNFLQLLPIKSQDSLPPLRVGYTPVYNFNFRDKNLSLMVKDDSGNPTYSFKDRASQIVSAFAKENNINTIIAASTGNAGSSIAGICASQNQKAIVFVPAAAPKAKLSQIIMYGAKIIPVDGTYDDAFDLSLASTQKFGFYNRNTAFNPLTIEGKKTVAFEIYSQLQFSIPERIFVPVGDGVIISGVFKGFEDLLKLKLISKMPEIIAVQAKGSSNLINNLNTDQQIFNCSNTIADSISVDIPRNFYMARNFINHYKCRTVMVDDGEILEASAILSKNTGLFAEPAATAAFAGAFNFLDKYPECKNESNMVISTGSGLKDLNSVQKIIQIPKPIGTDINNLEKYFDEKGI